MSHKLHTRIILQSAALLAAAPAFAALAPPDSTAEPARSIERRHVARHNEQGDVSPAVEPRDTCRQGSPWFSGIGHLPYGYESDATGISPDGRMVVGVASGLDPHQDSGAYRHAIYWNACNGISTLLTTPGYIAWSAATAVSDVGRTVVGLSNTAQPDAPFDAGTLWTNANDGIDILVNPNAGFNQRTFVNSISASGAVVAGTAEDSAGMAAFTFNLATNTSVMLGDLPGGVVASEANAVSNSAGAVVGRSLSGNGPEAFRWTSQTGMVGLGDLPGGAFDSNALAVSANGNAVVGYATTAAGRVAFRWTAQTGMVSLGDLPGGQVYSEATAVSGDGEVVVGRSSSDRGEEAFIWTASTGIRAIRDVAIGQLPQEFAYWNLMAARGISADGVVIVGSGINPQGYYEGWVIELPRTCRADWNRDGVVNTGDFFSFLTGFFSGQADFNNDAVTNTTDYFEFLTAFFAGC